MAEVREIPADETGVRLDRWFKRHFPQLGHGQVEKLLRTGQVREDGKRAKANARLESGQKVRLPPHLDDLAAAKPALKAKKDGAVRQWVLFEDEDVLILNKPPGLAVQGGTGQRERHLDAMLEGWRDAKGARPKLVHRLDKDTSGVLLLAKNVFSAARLAAAFRERDTRKVYWAVTLGTPKPVQGRIDLALKKTGTRMAGADGDPEGLDAATLYSVLEPAGKQAALVALWPLTGRTHQLRVHMQAIGTPILGDSFYRPAERVDGSVAPQWPEGALYGGLHLHARRLIIPHPRGGMIDASAPIPAAMQKTFRWFNFSGDQPDPFDGVDDGRSKHREKKK